MIDKVKMALRLTTDAFDSEIMDLIAAALADLGLVGITADKTDALMVRAVVTYCRLHFGSPSDFDKLKAAYDEQKAQMISASGYGLPTEVQDGI